MSPRYLLVAGAQGERRHALVRRLSSRTNLKPTLSCRRFEALVNPACHCSRVEDTGCILGTLFRGNDAPEPVTRLEAGETAAVSSSRGQALLRGYWGGYVAAVAGPGSLRILRDPSGLFPCYFARQGGFTLFASDAELLVAGGASIDIDFESIGQQLYRANVPAAATALRGIQELLPGFSLTLPGTSAIQEQCWSPWEHVASWQEEPKAAAERLSTTISDCIEAWASTCRHVLLSVSGGLDSSIIAACLARAGARTTCLTVFSDDPAGDERIFARALCGQLGLPLVERPYRLEDIDLAEPLAPHLPRPRDRTQANAYERVNLEVALEAGADAFMTGNGGDNVLGYSQSAAPIADRYLAEGIGMGTFCSLLDVCRQTGCSIFDALGRAWKLAQAPPAHRVRPKPLFLHPEFLATIEAAGLRHEWLDPPKGALPGKAAHVSTILRAQPTLEASRGFFLPLVSPLMSQPVIEFCLAIPSWEWRAGGIDRSLARRAFERDLPPAVLNRRIKGTPSRFAARLLDHFRPAIRERLLDGRLAANRIIDAPVLGKLLAGEQPVGDLQRVRILELVNAEAWIGHWTARRHQTGYFQKDVRSDGRGRPPAEGDPIP
jgi:asparagine synthase (glutamine-hydrolysing)